MTITSVESVKNKKMLKIFIDNQYSFTIPEEDYIRHNLYEDKEITEERIQHIRTNVLVRAARERAVRYLIIKDRSAEELLKKLVEAGFDSNIAKSAVESLKAIGYLDDAMYAKKYLSERLRSKALSQKALRYELERKGIDREIIESALSEFEIDEEEIALRAAKRKFGKYNIKDKMVERKILSFLAHRGFSYEVGQKVIKRMKNIIQ